MPVRPFSREQLWLLPPSLAELIPDDHPVRFVAAFVDELDQVVWEDFGIHLAGEPEGAPAYHPVLLLSVWLYGFMTGVRSSRRLEAACRDQLPYLWLTGNQRPDHNTLWRFYQEHRQGMRRLLKLTVRTAVAAGLMDLALQALDGSRIAGNASPSRSHSREALERLLRRTEAAIRDLEAQNATGGQQPPSRLPDELRQAQALHSQVREALHRIEAGESRQINLTDGDATLLKAPGGYLVGYNAQAVASPLAPTAGQTGQLITAAAVVNEQDVGQLLPMLEQAAENTGEKAALTLADAGYHSGPNLTAVASQERVVIIPEPQRKGLESAYHKDVFRYDSAADTYTCPQGQVLRYADTKRDRAGKLVRRYRAVAKVCRACPAFGVCTKDQRHGRALEIGPDDVALRQHRTWMATAEARMVYRRRKELIEPVFGIMKEQQGARRFLLRGLAHVAAEWSLLAAAFNLRTLVRVWQRGFLLTFP